jgi:hypothetical protein
VERTGDQRRADAVTGALAAALAFLLPSLALALDESSLAAAILTAAVVTLLGPAAVSAAVTARTPTAGVPPGRTVPLVLATRPTDPTHHPLRPRAPGRA